VIKLGEQFNQARDAYCKLNQKLTFEKWLEKVNRGKEGFQKAWLSKIMAVHSLVSRYPRLIFCRVGYTFIYANKEMIEDRLKKDEKLRQTWAKMEV
jgi:hypothetical protein